MEERLDPDVAWLVNEVVDDLTKYSIVAFVYERQRFEGDIATLAESIGLRPGPRFAEAVKELAAAEVILMGTAVGGTPVVLQATAGEQREIVAKLLALPADSPKFATIMRQLTLRSLERSARPMLEEH